MSVSKLALFFQFTLPEIPGFTLIFAFSLLPFYIFDSFIFIRYILSTINYTLIYSTNSNPKKRAFFKNLHETALFVLLQRTQSNSQS
jgi:hypothetical protein